MTSPPGDPAPAPPVRRLPPAARVLPKGVFYGWWVALACMVMMYVTVGVGYYGLAVFLGPLQDEHGWSNSVVSGATGLYFAASGVASFLAGPIIDRRGPRRFMITGIVLTAIGAALVGSVEAIWQLYLVYVLMAVAFGMGASVSVSSMLAKWFVEQRAKAISISSTGVSLGGATLVPLGSALVDRGGLELAAPVLGALVVIIALPTLLLVVSTEPGAMGLHPDGRDPRRPAPTGQLSAAVQRRLWTRAQAARTLSFWAVVAGFAMALATQTAVLIHQLSFLTQDDRLGSRGAAALAVTTTTIGSIVARLVVGMFADGWDKRRLTMLLFVMQGLAVFAYTVVDGTLAIYVVALTFGFTIGNIYMMQSLLVGEIFGMVSFATVMGVVTLSGQVGSGVGLVFMGWLHDRSGGYEGPFTVLGALNVAAAGVIAFARPVERLAGPVDDQGRPASAARPTAVPSGPSGPLAPVRRSGA